MFDLTGKKALVTGATGGLGSQIAKSLAAQGAIVAISGTRENVLTELSKEIPNSIVLTANLSEDGAAENLIARAEEALGGLDILVANILMEDQIDDLLVEVLTLEQKFEKKIKEKYADIS